jgi:ribosome-dependent ATPase
MTQHVATLRDVTLAYGKTQALRGLSLEIPQASWSA